EQDLAEPTRAYARDTVTLGWEDRTHVHGRRRADSGVEFATSLPRGTVLRAGDLIVLEDERLVIANVERPGPVFVVEPRTSAGWWGGRGGGGNGVCPRITSATAISR